MNSAIRLGPVDITIFAVYILGVLVLGIYSARKGAKTKRDYFLAGDKLPWWMIGGSIIASNMSSHQYVGMTGAVYEKGFVVIGGDWGAVLLGLNVLLWIFLPFYLRNGFYTMPEFLLRRYGDAARTAYGALILLVYMFVEIAAVLYIGALALRDLMNIPMAYSIPALAALTAVYTIAGGLRAVVWTEMLQLGVLLIGGIALTFAAVRAGGGLAGVAATSKDWDMILPYNDPYFPWTMYLGGVCVGVFYWATNQFVVQRALAAQNEWHARMGVVTAQWIKFLLPVMTVVPGLMAAKLFPGLERPDLAFTTLVKNLLPTGLIGLVMAGLIAAIMSHVSGAVNSCTTIATMDFYLPYIRKNASDAEAVRFGKAMGVVIVLFGIFWAFVLTGHSQKPIFLYLMDAYGYFAPGIVTMFVLGVFWKRTTHIGALTAGALTVPLSVALQLSFPHLPFYNRTGIVFWSCMLAASAVSLFTTPKPEEELKGLIWSKESLTLEKGQRYLCRGLRNPILWWSIVTALVLSLYVRYA